MEWSPSGEVDRGIRQIRETIGIQGGSSRLKDHVILFVLIQASSWPYDGRNYSMESQSFWNLLLHCPTT
jgi:hypothetical protein